MKIKFSHGYSKLIGGFEHIHRAKLIEVVNVNLEDLSNDFVDYDTDCGVFQLPLRGKFMMLIFQKRHMPRLFTTVRRWTEQKEAYYRENIGCIFDVEYKTEEAPSMAQEARQENKE